MYIEHRTSSGDMLVVRGKLHGSLHRTGRVLLRCVLFALLILSGAASAQLSTRDPASETPPSPAPEESAPTDDGAAEATGDAEAASEPAAASLEEDEPEAAQQPQLLLQLEQLFAELETLRRENTRLREQLEAATTSQENLLQQLRRENALMQEQLGAATNSQGGSPAELPSQTDENARAATQVQEQSPTESSQSGQMGTQKDEPNPQLQTEILELQQLVKIINDKHASLLAQLGSAEEAPGEQRTYVVQAGDSLSILANLYYGTGSRWPEILAANPSLTDPDRLIAGTVLVIP